MMKKYPLTPLAIREFQEELYRNDCEQLEQEAMLLCGDAVGWIAAHFELTVNQLELLRSVNQKLIMLMGQNLSTALLTRRPFVFKGLNLFEDSPEHIMNIKLANIISTEYSINDHQFKAAGKVVLTFSL